MDCAPYFSSPKAPIFVTGTKLSIAIQSLEAWPVLVLVLGIDLKHSGVLVLVLGINLLQTGNADL